MSNRIFLIGMPGCGKTHWGEIIAQRYELPFYDLDAYIEEREQMTIAEFFKQHNEKAFREIENDFLTEIIEDADTFVMACGGGTPCYKDNMNLMKQNGLTIYLEADIDMIIDRIQQHLGNRPLLEGSEDIKSRLHQILEERAPIYKQADHILQVDYISAATFDEIL